MYLCRFNTLDGETRVGCLREKDTVLDLTAAGVRDLQSVLENEDPVGFVTRVSQNATVQLPLAGLTLRPPVEQQEVWAAGVTYLRSKKARMEESDFSATAYDRVYSAPRPEIFFKALGPKVVGPAEHVGIRGDARWNVPEPELALVINSRGRIVGHTIGNDMSSRDIEGENLLYLPQAKVYDRSCALGPWIRLGADEAEARRWTVRSAITRGGQTVFSGETSINNLKRHFDELVGYLCRSQTFPFGAVLLTGTGIVPDDTFTLQAGDEVTIEISGIGVLSNRVVVV
jgi:2-dehydro-3-deoxy-D-arabinonate dehydratase